jgi:lipid-A-disaccharide synthase
VNSGELNNITHLNSTSHYQLTKTIFISTGEISGNIHGSKLAEKILEKAPFVKISGFGSIEMEQKGVTIFRDISKYSGVGLTENIPAFLKSFEILSFVKNQFSQNKPDLVLLIDNQGLNIQIAKIAKKHKIPVIYYIAPQEWIWGVKKGVIRVLNNTDKIITIFRKEFNFYQDFILQKANSNYSINKIEYVGHPLLDYLNKESKEKIKREINIPENIPVIALMAGSRKNEIDNLLPIFLETMELLKKKNLNYHFILICNEVWKEYITNIVQDKVTIYSKNSTYYMQACDVILAASGTVTLEAVILDVPIISCYKLSGISYQIAKLLVKIKYFSIPNIVASKKVIPEFLQDKVNPIVLSNELIKLISDKKLRNELLVEFDKIRNELSPYGAINKTAKIILDYLVEKT